MSVVEVGWVGESEVGDDIWSGVREGMWKPFTDRLALPYAERKGYSETTVTRRRAKSLVNSYVYEQVK